jgi:uncharacterized protein
VGSIFFSWFRGLGATWSILGLAYVDPNNWFFCRTRRKRPREVWRPCGITLCHLVLYGRVKRNVPVVYGIRRELAQGNGRLRFLKCLVRVSGIRGRCHRSTSWSPISCSIFGLTHRSAGRAEQHRAPVSLSVRPIIVIRMRTITIQSFVILFVCLSLHPTALHAASFNCANAALHVEKVFCNDPELSTLDEKLAAIYNDATYADPTYQKQFKLEQQSWLKKRNLCRDRICIKAAYQTRLSELPKYSAPEETPPYGATPEQVKAASCSGTQDEMNLCAWRSYRDSQKDLESILKDVRTTMRGNTKQLKALNLSQYKWMRKRDITCDNEASDYDGGSMVWSAIYGCRTRLNNARHAELESALH